MGKVSYIDFLVNPKYRAFPFGGIAGWALANRLPTVEDLQEMYDFTYYSSMNKAVTDVNGGTIGTNSDATKATAVAGVYTDAGHPYVVLLKDHTEATRIQPSADMTINLGGHKLSSDNVVCINVLGGNLTIDGRLSGSSIEVTQDSNAAICVQIPSSSTSKQVLINGGTYLARCTNGRTGALNLNGVNVNVAVSGCNVVAENESGESIAIISGINCVTTVSNCNILATAANVKAYGVYIYGTATVSNCDIRAYSNYHKNGGGYSALSQGVRNSGTLTIENSYVMGTHAGAQNDGTLYVNGGTYEGYGHGGIFFCGAGTTTYVRNATLKDMLTMPEGYEATSSQAGAAFHIGGSADDNNITVYMDNCDLYGSSNQGVLIGSNGEKNNSLYISNSRLHKLGGGDTTKLRLDGGNHTIYIGAGNSFTEANVAFTTGEYADQYPSHVVVTDEEYTQ